MRTHNMTGNAGLFYASWRLSQLGWNVIPTSRNTRGVDLLACDHTFTRSLAVQVKALTKRNATVPLGLSLDKVAGDWWIVVIGVHEPTPDVFVLTPDEVRAGAATDSKGQHWLTVKSYQRAEYRNAFDRLGAP